MRRAYTFRRSLEEFAAAREQFNSLVNRLQSEETAWMEHGEVEALVATEGMELLRCFAARPSGSSCGAGEQAGGGHGC